MLTSNSRGKPWKKIAQVRVPGKWLLKKSIFGKESAHTVSLSQLSYPTGQKWSVSWTILVSQGESSCWPWQSFWVMTGLLPLTWHPYSRCHWLSIQVDLHLYPYFSCSLSIDWVISCLVNPVEKDTSNFLCRLYWLVFLKPRAWNLKWCEEKSALKWANSNVSASHCIIVLSRSVWSGACLLTSSSIC